MSKKQKKPFSVRIPVVTEFSALVSPPSIRPISKKQKRPFSFRIPITEVLAFTEPATRDISRRVSHRWNADELKTRHKYYHLECQQLMNSFPARFSPNIDYRNRFITLSKQDYSQSSLEPAAALLEFNRQYKVFVVGKVPNISKDVAGHALAVVCEATAGDEFRECDVCLTKMINGTESHHCDVCDYDLCRNCAAINAAATKQAENLVLFTCEIKPTIDEENHLTFDINLNNDNVQTEDNAMDLKIWIENRTTNKITLFGEHFNIFRFFEGFDHNLDPVEPAGEFEFDVGGEFDGGYDAGSLEDEGEKFDWWEPMDSAESKLVTKSLQYVFEAPSGPDFSGIDVSILPSALVPDLNYEEEQDNIIESWYNTSSGMSTRPLRIQIKYTKADYENEWEDSFVAFTPQRLMLSLRSGMMKWF